MNITKRLVLGFASSALLAVGLARAADLFDPMSRSLNEGYNRLALNGSADSSRMPETYSRLLKGAPDTSGECGIVEDRS